MLHVSLYHILGHIPFGPNELHAYKYHCGLPFSSFKLDMAIISFFISLTRVAMLPIFILLLCIPPPMALSLTFKKLPLPTGVNGPSSSAFDSLGGGPYVSVQDGRILKYKEATACFVEFAFDAPTRLIWNIFHALPSIYIYRLPYY
jgi:hypothetical protein